MKRLSVLALLLVCGCCCAKAQTAIYGAFSASNYNTPNIGWQSGATFGLYDDMVGVPFVRAGLDVRGSFLGSGNAAVNSILGGVRVQLHPHVLPLMPYAEALGGGAHVNVGTGAAHTDSTGFEYALVGGLDWTIFPRIDWRAVEYSWGEVTNVNGNVHPNTVSTGLVLRLP